MENKLFGLNLLGKKREEPKPDVKKLKQEEVEGLRRFYKEIVPPETLEENFLRWKSHLEERLKNKYPDPFQLESALNRAITFASRLPIRHATRMRRIKRSTSPYISSDFMTRGLGVNWSDATKDFDRENELNHFVYGSLGIAETNDGLNSWGNLQAYIKPQALNNEGTIVALEDWWGAKDRLHLSSSKKGDEDLFKIHLQQIWRGKDFEVLLPLMLAYAYEKPEDFDEQKPFPLDFVPEGLPRITTIKAYLEEAKPAFPRFEVRIPGHVSPSDITAFVVDSSAIKEQSGLALVVVPSELSPEDKRKFIREKLEVLQR